jgi:hypothetical protein
MSAFAKSDSSSNTAVITYTLKKRELQELTMLHAHGT